MGFNMVPCSRLTKGSKVKKSSELNVSKRRKVLKSKSVGQNEGDVELKVELFSSLILIEQLLIEILLRLPVDSVCRFKLVCKHWCSLLSSDYFVSRFSECNNHNRQQCPFTLVFQFIMHPRLRNTKNLVPIGAISNHPVLSKSLRNNKPLDLNIKRYFGDNLLKIEDMNIIASCDDLLLCGHFDRCYNYFDSLYVVNLLTRCWIHIPPPPISDLPATIKQILSRQTQYQKAGLLCSHGLYNFKVILLPTPHSETYDPRFRGRGDVTPHRMHASQFSVQIFSSESRQWVDITVDWYPFSLHVYMTFTPILSHEGKLHWLNGRSLVSLDLDDNNLSHLRLHSIALPNELSLEFPCGFGVCQGQFRVARLLYSKADGGNVLLVWDLEDYHKGVWQLAHRVLLCHQSSFKLFQVMAFHPFNRDIVFVALGKDVFQFNMRTEKLESYYPLKLEKGYHTQLRELSPFPLLFHRGLPTAVPAHSELVH